MPHSNNGEDEADKRLLAAREACDRVRERMRSRQSHVASVIARKKEEEGNIPNRPKAAFHRGVTGQDGKAAQWIRKPTNKKRSPLNASISSISELEPVTIFNDSASLNMSSLSYLTGSNESMHLSFSGVPTLAQGPSLFEADEPEKHSSSAAPKMPRRSEARMDFGNDSNSSLSLDDIMQEPSKLPHQSVVAATSDMPAGGVDRRRNISDVSTSLASESSSSITMSESSTAVSLSSSADASAADGSTVRVMEWKGRTTSPNNK